MDGGGTAIVRLISQANVGVKGSHKCEAHHFFGLHSLQRPPGLHFRQKLLAKLEGSLVRRGNVCRARCRTLNCLLCIHCDSFYFRSPVLTSPLWHPACLCDFAGSDECFGGHMAKIIEFYIPQSFRTASKWVYSAERGKVLAFRLLVQKTA